MELSLDEIRPNPIQPRKSIDKDRLFELSAIVRIDLTGVAGAGIDYQVPLSVYYDLATSAANQIGVVASKVPAKNDSGSLRFYGDDGAVLPFYVEGVADDGAGYNLATIWVKVAADLSSNQTIYMVDTGDVGAANVSSGNDTFELFDGFNAGTLDAAKWTGAGVTFAGTGEAGYALLTGANSDITLQSVNSFPDGRELVVNGRFANASAGGNGFITGFDAQYYYYNKSADTANSYIGKGSYGSSDASQGSRIVATSTLQVSVARAGGVGRVLGYNAVGTLVQTDSTGVPTAAAPLVLNHVYATGTAGRAETAYLRKWVGVTEPSFSAATSLVGKHDHSSAVAGGTTIRPASVACSGQSSFTAGAAQEFGVTVNGSSGFDAHGFKVNSVDSGTNKIGVGLRFTRNDSARWTIKKSDDAESGSDAGSRLVFLPTSDAGASLPSLQTELSRDGRVSIPSVAPANASAPGRAGTITWDSSYIYVCVATDTWKRVAIATW